MSAKTNCATCDAIKSARAVVVLSATSRFSILREERVSCSFLTNEITASTRTLRSVVLKRKHESHNGSHRDHGPTRRLSGQAVVVDHATCVSSIHYKRSVVTGKQLSFGGGQ